MFEKYKELIADQFSNFKTSAKGALANAKGAVIPGLSQLKAKLDDRIRHADAVATVFANLSTELVETGQSLVDSMPSEVHVESIGEEQVNLLLDMLGSETTDAIDSIQGFGLHLSDSFGRQFNIVSFPEAHYPTLEYDGILYDVVVASCPLDSIYDINDAIVIRNTITGEYFINQNICSVTKYLRAWMPTTEGLTLYDRLYTYYTKVLSGQEGSYTMTELVNLCGINYSEWRSLWGVFLNNSAQGPSPKTLFELFASEAVLVNGSFQSASLRDVLRDQLLNTTLLSMGRDLAEDMCGASFDLSASLMKHGWGSPELNSGVADFLQQFHSVFTRGGIISAGEWLISYFTSTSVLCGDDGVLSFTDNNQYATSVYLAGFVDSIFNLLGNVVQLIGAIFGPVFAVIGSVVGTILTTIPKMIYYDYNNETTGKVFLGASLNAYPYNLLSGEIERSDWRTLLDTCGPQCIDMGFAILLVGKGVSANTIRYELHLVPYFSNVDALSFYARFNGCFFIHTDGDGFDCAINPWRFAELFSTDDLLEIASEEDRLDLSSFPDDTALDDGMDEKIRLSMMCSMAYLLQLCFCGSYTVKQPRGKAFLVPYDAKTRSNKDPNFLTALGLAYACGVSRTNVNYTDDIGHWMSNLISDCTWKNFSDGLTTSSDEVAYKSVLGVANQVLYGYLAVPYFVLLIDYDDVPITGLIGVDDYQTRDSDDNYMYLTWNCKPLDFVRVNMLLLPSLPPFKSTTYSLTCCNGFTIGTPKYDKKTFIFTTIMASIVAVAATALTVVAVMKVKKKMKTASGLARGKAEQAWYAYTANPTPENFKAYRKAVFKNNLLATFTGGTKLNKWGYWDDPGESADLATTQEEINKNEREQQTQSLEDSSDRILTVLVGPHTP